MNPLNITLAIIAFGAYSYMIYTKGQQNGRRNYKKELENKINEMEERLKHGK